MLVSIDITYRPFACGVCGRTFSQRSDCLSHQETHSGENIFFLILKQHSQIHYPLTADKSFFCKQCYKSFHKKSGLRNHMKTHQKDCTDSIPKPPNVVAIANNDGVQMTYVTEIYSTSDN